MYHKSEDYKKEKVAPISYMQSSYKSSTWETFTKIRKTFRKIYESIKSSNNTRFVTGERLVLIACCLCIRTEAIIGFTLSSIIN